jgi:actin-related protein 6
LSDHITVPSEPAEAILVIDSGFSHTNVIPILRGKPIQSAIRRLEIGGKFLTNYLKELISIRHYNMLDEFHLVNEVKEAISYVSPDFDHDLGRTWKENIKKNINTDEARIDYVLPEYNKLQRGYKRPHDPLAAAKTRKAAFSNARGASPLDDEPSNEFMTLGNEQFVVPELLFNPNDVGMRQPGIAQMIMQSLSTLPEGLVPAMLANVVLVGGNWNIPGAAERLEAELRMTANADYKVRVGKPRDPATYIWRGGVNLAKNTEVLKDLVVTKEEYQEHGAGWAARKFANAR